MGGAPAKEDFVKVLFRYQSDVLEELTVETMWVTIVDKEKGHYQLDSIPFYGPPVAPGDIIFAEFDAEENYLTYRKTVSHSDNSVIQIMVQDETNSDIEIIRGVFQRLGCISEKLNKNFFVMEVFAKTNYRIIRDKLENLEKDGLIEFAEPWLSSCHSNQIV